jgi:hypothetical protein
MAQVPSPEVGTSHHVFSPNKSAARASEGSALEEYGDLEEAQRDSHAPVHGSLVAEDGAGEHDESPAVVGCVLQQVGFQTQPELEALVERRRLRGCVRVMEGVLVDPRCFTSAVTSDGAGPADEVPPVDVIARVERYPRSDPR